jgi:superfamily II DNA/RNA helicase
LEFVFLNKVSFVNVVEYILALLEEKNALKRRTNRVLKKGECFVKLEQLSSYPAFLVDLWTKAGFKELTPIQEKAIPLLLENQDLIIESPTGTGKTLAYLIPIFNKLQMELKKTQVVILAPTRELVMQIQKVTQDWVKGSGITTAALIGGADIKRQVEKLKTHPQIVIGTPSRVQELITMKKLKMHEVKTLVLDEADQLLVPDMVRTIEAIIKSTLNDRQLVVVSATVTDRAETLAREFMKTPETVRVERPSQAESTVEHLYYVCQARDKIDQLRQFVKKEPIKALVFINGTNYIPEVAKRLRSRGVQVGILSGEGKKTEREATIQQFRQGQFPLLLTTDLAARGLDIEGLTHVIHFDLPENVTQYIHRSGRTGRQGAKGTVVSFLTYRDEKALQQFAKQLNLKLQKKELETPMTGSRPPRRSTSSQEKGRPRPSGNREFSRPREEKRGKEQDLSKKNRGR